MSGTTWCYTTVQKLCSIFCSNLRNKMRNSLIILSTDELNLKELQVEAWVVSMSLGNGRTPPCFVWDRFRKEKKHGISVWNNSNVVFSNFNVLTCESDMVSPRRDLRTSVRGWYPGDADGGPRVEWEGSRDVFLWPNMVASSHPCLSKCKWFKIKDNLKPYFLGHTSCVSSECWVAAMLDGAA